MSLLILALLSIHIENSAEISRYQYKQNIMIKVKRLVVIYTGKVNNLHLYML